MAARGTSGRLHQLAAISGLFAEICFMPLCQNCKTLKATTLHAVFHCLTSVRRLERVNRVDVFEHERQVEQAELLW